MDHPVDQYLVGLREDCGAGWSWRKEDYYYDSIDMGRDECVKM